MKQLDTRSIKEIKETEDSYVIEFEKIKRESDEETEEETEDISTEENSFKEDDEERTDIVTKEKLYRTFNVDRSSIDEESRSVTLAFSSEAPVERSFGIEVLNHTGESVRLGRLNNKAPLLVNHQTEPVIGVVERANIDSDKIGRAIVRFGRSTVANEIFEDVKDGIRSQVSVGYKIHEMEKDNNSDDNLFRATDWEPFEVSIVSIGADQTVGIGRSSESEFKTSITERTEKMGTEITNEPVVDVAKIEADIQKRELNRIKEIEAYGAEHSEKELAREYIVDGRTVPEFQCAILEKIANRPTEKVHEIGLTPKETRNFSWLKIIRALANPADRKMQEDASFEFEASRAQAQKSGVDPQGAFVPADVIYGQKLKERADLIVGTDSLGGYTVQTDVLAQNFIDVLRANMVFSQLGITELNGLNGKVSIPGISSGSTAYWVAENSAITESTPTFIARTMDGKTCGAMTDISRNLMLQSSMDVEAFVRNEIARNLAVEIENKGLVGDGSSNAPTGVNSTTGVTSEALATADTPLQADIVAMWKALASNNALRGNLAWVGASTALANMMATPRTATYGDIMILDPNVSDMRLMGYPVYSSENCVFGSINKLFFGDWSSLVMGTWGNGLDLIVDPYTGSSAGTTRVVGLYLVDFCVRTPKSFAITTNP